MPMTTYCIRLMSIALSLALLSACGFVEKRDDYERVENVAPLTVPSDLDTPNSNSQLRVPEVPSSGQPVSDRPRSIDLQSQRRDPDSTDSRRIQWQDGQPVLRLRQDIDESFTSVFAALGELNVDVQEEDRDGATILINYIDEYARSNRPGVMSRWFLRRKGPEDQSGDYRLSLFVEDQATGLVVTVDDGNPAEAGIAERILLEIDRELK